MKNENFEITTSRYVMRPWTENDLESYLVLARDPGYCSFASAGSFALKHDTALEKIRERIAMFEEKKTARFLVTEKQTGRSVGTCGFAPYKLEGQDIMELGYRFCLLDWNKGIATETGKAAIADAFARLKLKKVFAFAVPQNRGSLRVIEKLGFMYVKNFLHATFPHALYELKK